MFGAPGGPLGRGGHHAVDSSSVLPMMPSNCPGSITAPSSSRRADCMPPLPDGAIGTVNAPMDAFWSIHRHGFVRVAACTITTALGRPAANADAVLATARECAADGVGLA